MLRRTWTLRNLNVEKTPYYTQLLHRCLSSTAKVHDDEDHQEARAWLARFNATNTIPKNICEVTFSRSSGPGGQNVNKYENSLSSPQEHYNSELNFVE